MITIQLSNTTAQINVPVHVTAQITSDIAIKNIEWLSNTQTNFSVSQDQKTVNFTPSVNGEYVFTITVWDIQGGRQSAVTKITVGAVTPTPTPIPPAPTPTGDVDRFGLPFLHKTKTNGYFYQMSDNPINDIGIAHLDSDFTVSNGVITMKCNGPTSFGVGKNINTFKDSIDGCKMNFKTTAARGYAFKPDDVRDLEYKCIMKFNNIGSHGFSISSCTGHHDSSSDPCCQGFSYMFNIDDVAKSPTPFRFRKEMYHVSYSTSPEGTFTNPQINFKLDGHGYFGFGFCRYNKADRVVLEGWINPNPEQDKKNWVLVKRIEDFKGKGWGSDGDKCGGDKDQVGTWSNAQNRLKTNATNGTIDFKCVSFREIDPSLD